MALALAVGEGEREGAGDNMQKEYTQALGSEAPMMRSYLPHI